MPFCFLSFPLPLLSTGSDPAIWEAVPSQGPLPSPLPQRRGPWEPSLCTWTLAPRSSAENAGTGPLLLHSPGLTSSSVYNTLAGRVRHKARPYAPDQSQPVAEQRSEPRPALSPPPYVHTQMAPHVHSLGLWGPCGLQGKTPHNKYGGAAKKKSGARVGGVPPPLQSPLPSAPGVTTSSPGQTPGREAEKRLDE